jgi:hypothetical protein
MKVVVYENEKVVNTFEGNDIYVACGRRLFATYDVDHGYYTRTGNIKLRKFMLKTTLRDIKRTLRSLK